MNLPLPAFVDERFLKHRLRATSTAGITSAVLALVLFLYRYYHDHVFRIDLLVVGLVFVVLKYALLFWYRTHRLNVTLYWRPSMLLKQGRRPSTLWRWAMVCLLAFFALPLVTRIMPLASQDLVDGIRGALLGATLALMVLSGVLKRRIANPCGRVSG